MTAVGDCSHFSGKSRSFVIVDKVRGKSRGVHMYTDSCI